MIIDRIKAHNVPINDIIVEGPAKVMLKDFEDYIRVSITSIFDTGPEELKFIDLEMATPAATYKERTKVRSGRKANNRDRKNSNIAPSKGFPIEDKNFYMVKLHIALDGERLDPVNIFLPFLDQDGLTKIYGSVFSLTPVISDKNISVDKNNIFCPIELREKLIFKRCTHNLIKNGRAYTSTLAYENIYRGSKDKSKKASLKQILPYFLFAKFGMLSTFKKYLNTDIAVGMGDAINRDDYPALEWDIYESTKQKPVKFTKYGPYVGTDLRIAIKRKDIKTTSDHFLLNQLVGGVFYLADRYPEKVEIEHLDNVYMWRQIFAYIIIDKNSTLDVMLEQADRNIRSIDNYLDPITKNMFKQNGVELESFYDLLAYIASVFVPMMRENTTIMDYYDKRLVLHKHIAEPLICKINDFIYTVIRTKANKPDKKLVAKSVRNTLTQRLYPTVLETINNRNACVNPFSTSSDNKLWDLSTLVVLQSDHNRVNSKNKPSPIEDPSKKVSASSLEVLSPLGASKSEPCGTNRLNPFVLIDQNKSFSIERREELIPIIEKVEQDISQ